MHVADAEGRDRLRPAKDFLRGRLKALVGLDDTTGIEILVTIRGLARMLEITESQGCGGPDLSGPRWGVLLALMGHEQLGEGHGLTPTALSHFQGVSKNTVSSLLRGLEEQGYIERTLDPDDYRVFRIQLTDAGREVVRSVAPKRMAYVNRLASGLSVAEREQLVALLEKLHRSIAAHSHARDRHCHGE